MAQDSAEVERFLRETVEVLASDEFGGRAFGSGGTVQASCFIAQNFEHSGLLPMGQNWYHCFQSKKGIGRNVIGILPGKSRKYILVSAWYDGLGTLDGKVYGGADANASGVAAMLYMADRLAKAPRCEYGIIFAALDGHTDSLSGADAFLAQTAIIPELVLNLDTIGSDLAPVSRVVKDYMIVLGAPARWHEAMINMATQLSLRLYFDYYGSKVFTELFYKKASDQAPFIAAGIPALMFTSGITANTNKTSDTPKSLNYNLLRRRAEFVARWIETRNNVRP
ncbi:MAG: M28 family peptidase [Bacteroidales bacterium]|nr:M28 family peptidase [Bacteroidales bacterium]